MAFYLPLTAALAGLPSPVLAQASGLAPIEDRDRAVECLTLAVAYEAGYESLEGRQAVAEVVLNRMLDRAFPKTVCGVVFAGSTRRTGCQFTFTCDGSLRRRLPAQVVAAARAVAEQVIDGQVPPQVAGATHYHADYVNPYWASSLTRLAQFGAHIFYSSGGAKAFGRLDDIPAAGRGMPMAIAGQISAEPSQGAGRARVFAPWGITPEPDAAPGR